MKHIIFISFVITTFYNFAAEEPLKINSGLTVTEIEDPQITAVLHFRKNSMLDPHSIINYKKQNLFFHEICAHAATLIATNKYRCIDNTTYNSQHHCEHLRLIIEALISIFHHELRKASLSVYNSNDVTLQRRILLPLSVENLNKISFAICTALKNKYEKIIFTKQQTVTRLTEYLWHTLWSIPWYKELENDSVFLNNIAYLKEPGSHVFVNNTAQYLPDFNYISSLCTQQSGNQKHKTLSSNTLSNDSILALIKKYAETLRTKLTTKPLKQDCLTSYITEITNGFLQTYGQMCASTTNHELSLKQNHQEFINLVHYLFVHFLNIELSAPDINKHILDVLYLCLYLSPSYHVMLKLDSKNMQNLHNQSILFFKEYLHPCIQQNAFYETYKKYCLQNAYSIKIYDNFH